MVGKYRDGALPEATAYSDAELTLQSLLAETAATADECVLRLDFAGGIAAVKAFVDAVNLYVTEQEPWALAKDEANAERLSTVLYTICESLRAIAVLYHPLMPKATASLWEQLGADVALGPIGEQPVQTAGEWGRLPAGARVTKGAILFPRLEDPVE